jgi:hypothetical protein
MTATRIPTEPRMTDQPLASKTGVLAAGATVFVVATEAEQVALAAKDRDGAIRLDQQKAYLNLGTSTGTMADWAYIA